MYRASESVLGSVLSLWRYPVKSMLGEQLTSAYVTARGLLGDRAYALVDESTGKVASAKNPRKWRRLLEFRAVFVEPPSGGQKIPSVRITLPDGAIICSQQSDINQTLSGVFGRHVRLATMPPKSAKFEEYWPDIDGLARREAVTDEPMAVGAPAGTFFDLAAVHLLTTATLNRLRGLHPQGRFEVPRFRPNILVQPVSGEESFLENAWVGHILGIGEEVRLSIITPCPRCVMTTLAQGNLPSDSDILRTVARHNRVMIAALGGAMPSVGVYATVVRGGTIHHGDSVRLLGSSYLRRAAVFARAYWRVLAGG